MKFTETPIKGAFVIEVQKFEDDRGIFGRSFCEREFEEHGLTSRMVQTNVSFNYKKGTLRGIHYQIDPHQESKLVRCTRGSLYDVVVDLRPGSPTYMQWFGVELTADSYRMLLIPEDCGHAFQTLEDNTEAIYQVSQFYTPGAEAGIRWNDPAIGIKWPLPVSVISEKDANWPDFKG